MDFAIPEEERAFRREIRDFLATELTEEVVREAQSEDRISSAGKDFIRKLGDRGWISLTWPVDEGGAGRPAMDRFILNDELIRAEAPGAVGTNVGGRIVAPVLLLYGSEQQKRRLLPRIARGEIDFALGYTEPDAGSDLASLQTRAVWDGECYVVTGQKLYSTGAHFADYHWLAARTDPTQPRHGGISLFIVDMRSPGITVRPLHSMMDLRTNVVFYDHVRVPREALVGQENQGFAIMSTALSLERMFVTGDLRRVVEDLLDYARRTESGGRRLIDDVSVRRQLAQLATEVEIARLFSYRVAWQQSSGRHPGPEATIVKLFITELQLRLATAAIDLLGADGELIYGEAEAPLGGFFERFYRRSIMRTIVGGTSEIMRNVIAQRHLGLPR
ncbi:MAG: acyl-CoA dehydrogenase [Chloroflexi bacterium]|nr:MAG: acyl-CoA dehydrogenase [Chloroflexota bacterium]